MSKKYDISIWEIADFLCKYISEKPSGFSQTEIIEAEKRLGITFPDIYKKYILSYGKNTINDVFNHINAPCEIFSSYEGIAEFLEEDEDFFKNNASKSENQNNGYFPFFLSPKEQWHKYTENYILIWCENQCVWWAGYLKKDILNGITNPPVYISIEDDFITFEKAWQNTETFLKEMLFFAAWEKDFDCYENSQEIINVMKSQAIEKEKMLQKGIHTCLDTETQKLYFYCSQSNCPSEEGTLLVSL